MTLQFTYFHSKGNASLLKFLMNRKKSLPSFCQSEFSADSILDKESIPILPFTCSINNISTWVNWYLIDFKIISCLFYFFYFLCAWVVYFQDVSILTKKYDSRYCSKSFFTHITTNLQKKTSNRVENLIENMAIGVS